MTSSKMRSALQALAQGNEHRSVIARVRDVFEDIEAALAAGVSRKAIVDALAEQGLTLSLRSLDNALYAIRKQRRKNPGAATQQPKDAATPRQTKGYTVPAPKRFVHDPTKGGPDDDLLK